MSSCPNCEQVVAEGAKVCAHCLYILERTDWRAHDAGRLGADDRGRGRTLEDPPVGPIPLPGSGIGALGSVGSAFAGAFRLFMTGVLTGWGRGANRRNR